MRKTVALFCAVLMLLAILGSQARLLPQQSQRQDVIKFGIDLKLEPLKLAAADFRQNTAGAAPLVGVFNEVLWNDLDSAGILDLVSKSFYPPAIPGRREDLAAQGALAAWANPPTNAQMLAFGNAAIVSGRLVVEGYLFDVQNSARPEILARRYTDETTERAARAIAHRFANAIMERLGGGLPGIFESKIYFCRSPRPGTKEIWAMDYDGANQRAITRYGSLALTPNVSPDGARLAFTSYSAGNPDIFIFSLDSMRRLTFHNPPGLNTTPSWSPDGKQIAFSASFTGDPEIYLANADGSGVRRLTSSRGVDISPVWNPKTGAQIAFVSDRGGGPQVYVMDADGSNVRRLSGGGGDAVTPAWAPNGQTLAFSWTRGFAPGNYNIFLIDVATGQLVQLTHGAGRNEHPWFSPDGRQIVFESDRRGGKQIFAMLADGAKVRPLTSAGNNTSPVWSAR